MGIFSTIMSKIFGHAEAATTGATADAQPAAVSARHVPGS